MKRKKQLPHMALLDHLDGNEAYKLLKQASKIRKLALQKGGRKPSIGEVLGQLSAPMPLPSGAYKRGRVSWVGSKTARIDGEEADLNGLRLAVGDFVCFADFEGHLKVVEVEPRRTALSRSDVDNPHLEQVIVANVDVIGIVVSVKAPPLHPRLIDRYLVAIQHGGAEPLLVVNKCDLLTEDRLAIELRKVAPYAVLDVPLFVCSTETQIGLDGLRDALKGRTCAFVGHSGVGKSSLANALFPELHLKVGELMSGHGRGAHTTSASCLHDVGDGTCLIDTPGIRSFGLGKMPYLELQAAFPEFRDRRCKFRDCRHRDEPQCGVKLAVKQGEIFAERYDAYLRLLEEVA